MGGSPVGCEQGSNSSFILGEGVKQESCQVTYPGKCHAGGIHRRGGWYRGAVATEHHQAGQAIEERGHSRSWLLEEQEPGKGPLKKEHREDA